jgi:flagellar biosynthesis anti-sigma factor FlgM
MQIYGPSLHGIQPINTPHVARPSAPASSSPSQVSDQLDISPAGQFLDQISQMPEIRQDRVNQLRDAIASGKYETDAKLNTALDRLLDEIG